ncbi:MAG TPA: trypsin-like peptidase domain-containing protein [Planctomycetota bacterium]|nr:trypsin-like peptidase domain-containing protein [Planctomycetota bacterium]
MNVAVPARLFVMLLCALAAVAVGVRRPASAPIPDAVAPGLRATPPAPGTTIPDVVERVTPAVVSIFTSRSAPASSSPVDPLGLFGVSAKNELGLGSGVIARSDGIIVTNHHVVDAGAELRVVLADRREFRARVIGRDPQTDIAVLRIDAEGLPTIPFGDSGQLRVGETVLAIGNSFGIGQTVSCGILTAKGRANVGIVDDEDFLQTDAAVNPGNSGGPLLNLSGEVIGINTAIATRSGGFQGIGFAIPSRLVSEIVELLLREGRVSRGQLGVVVQDLTPALARAFSAPEPGVIITELPEKGAARDAGLRRGDILLKLDGAPVESTAALRHRAAMRGGGAKVRLDVWRDHKILQFAVRLQELHDPTAAVSSEEEAKSGEPFGPGGITVAAVPRDLLHRAGFSDEDGGVMVTTLPAAASFAGLRRGDVIVEVRGKTVRKADDFREAVARSPDPVLLRVRRPEGSVYVSIPKGSE